MTSTAVHPPGFSQPSLRFNDPTQPNQPGRKRGASRDEASWVVLPWDSPHTMQWVKNGDGWFIYYG
jgi:hypothetical protein